MKAAKKKRKLHVGRLVGIAAAVVLLAAICLGAYTILFSGIGGPEYLRQSSEKIQNTDKVLKIKEKSGDKDIAVFYPKFENEQATSFFEKAAKEQLKDAKAIAKELPEKSMVKVDFQNSIFDNKYLFVTFMTNVKGPEDQNAATVKHVSYQYDLTENKELSVNEIFKQDGFEKIALFVRPELKANQDVLNNAHTMAFIEATMPDADNYKNFFIHDNTMEFYFNKGELFENSPAVGASVNLADFAGSLAIDAKVAAGEPKKVNIPKRVVNKEKPMIALTFDDGPHIKNTPKLLKALEKYDAAATFYMVGSNMGTKGQQIVLDVVNSGSEIGSHSYSHPDLRTLSGTARDYQYNETTNLVKEITDGQYTIKTYRPPYGGVNDSVKESIPYPMIMWDIDTLDWKTKDVQATVDAIMKDVKDGTIILMHDIHAPSVEAAVKVIPMLIEKGYQLVTVDELMEARGVTMQNGVRYYSTTNFK